ncbi:MAG: citramalate synthase, partial [Clostridium sp.]
MGKVQIFDSTLRDGAQGQGISFSMQDKIKIVKALDNIGVTYIEAGNPGSNPKDMEFFKRVKELKLENSKLCAFGSTRRPKVKAKEDLNVINLLKAQTDVVVIFGKAWSYQVDKILKTTLEENINMIRDTVSFFKSKDKEVIFDAEHFFDGYKENSEYAIKTIESAKESGATTIVLCDTNGGTLPEEIKNITSEVRKIVKCKIGVHCHDDIGMAVANSIMGVLGGATQIQGTFIGVGERCGNANLSSIIPTLKYKLGIDSLDESKLKDITSTGRYIAEISNITLKEELAYIGSSAFAHKGGMHIDAVCKEPKAYEHIDPELIGNNRRFLISEVSGKSTVLK